MLEKGLLLPLLLLLLAAADTCRRSLVVASDCPLDFSWSNITTVATACSDQNDRGKCCRYINALIAVSVANYAAGTGILGVPSPFSDMCITSISDILTSNGISPNAAVFCGLGTKILVNYRCKGRATILEMLQSPNFTSVLRNCQMPFSEDVSCKRCLNSGIAYLRHLTGPEDNVTLNTCRDAAFVSLANQGDDISALDMANCYFSVQGLGIPSVNASVAPSPLLTPAAPPGPVTSVTPVLSRPPSQPSKNMPATKPHQPYRLTLIQGVGIGVTGLAVLLLVIMVLLIRKKNKELDDPTNELNAPSDMFTSNPRKCPEGPSPMFKRYSYKETKKATCNFSSVIGRGGFGTVYRAQFSDGSVAAVKRMNKVCEQGEEDFCREMELLGRLHHRHLVALRGICIDRHNRFLIYEYMENGNLKDNLHSPGREPLNWQTRIRIAIDVANALEYLHFYCDPALYHRDIKSSNILLDENFVAKLADFGLAHASRTGAVSFEPVNTDIRGTPGYLDPEYVVTRQLSEKSDIYSYGVVLLELVTGRHAIQDNRNIVEWFHKFMCSNNKLHELVDPRITDTFDLEQLHVMIGIIQWCTQGEGRARPSIKQVLRILYEGLDPVQRDFMEAIGDEEEDGSGRFYGGGLGMMNRGKSNQGSVIPHSGDARGLMSSSSTSRSYCSRSFLLESGSPQSPSANLSG